MSPKASQFRPKMTPFTPIFPLTPNVHAPSNTPPLSLSSSTTTLQFFTGIKTPSLLLSGLSAQEVTVNPAITSGAIT